MDAGQGRGPGIEAEVRALGRPDPLSDPALFRELREKYLVWDPFFAGARRVDILPLVLSERLHRNAVATAETAVAAVSAAGERAHADADERAHYGFHPDVTQLIEASFRAGDCASFARVDLLLAEDGTFRACEINADSPGGHNEALGLPHLARAAGFLEGVNPTTVVDDLALRLAALAKNPDGSQGTVGMIFATAYAEDLQICALLKRTLGRMGVPAVFAPPTGPQRKGSALALGGTPIRALYRYFPTEYMQGQANLPVIVSAVSRGEVRTVPSFSQMYLQSKLAFARAFALREDLGAEHSAAALRTLPETFNLTEVPADKLLAEREDWVLKRALGRVGAEVFIGRLTAPADWKGLVDELKSLITPEVPGALREVWVAQRWVPQRPIPTPFGDRFVTLGAYVLEGRFAGYFARVTPISHVSHDALCVPVFVAPSALSAPSTFDLTQRRLASLSHRTSAGAPR